MRTRRCFIIACLLLMVVPLARAAETLPSQLSDQDFWKLSSESSETDGTFRSDNLLSNEIYFQYVIPPLSGAAKQGRVYMGVGPEQNFTYIAALKPHMVFIVDIRRGNLDLQLMYKALFELSKDRAEFVSRLFAKKEPEGIGPNSTVEEIFNAISRTPSTEEAYVENLAAIKDHLMKKHSFPLSDNDLDGIDWVYSNFRRFGPASTTVQADGEASAAG